jgi:hypothetical protein
MVLTLHLERKINADGRVDITELDRRSPVGLPAAYVAMRAGHKLRLVPPDALEPAEDDVVFRIRTTTTTEGRRFVWLYLNGGSGRRGRPSAEQSRRAAQLLADVGICRRGPGRVVTLRLGPDGLVVARRA